VRQRSAIKKVPESAGRAWHPAIEGGIIQHWASHGEAGGRRVPFTTGRSRGRRRLGEGERCKLAQDGQGKESYELEGRLLLMHRVFGHGWGRIQGKEGGQRTSLRSHCIGNKGGKVMELLDEVRGDRWRRKSKSKGSKEQWGK